MIKDVVGVVIWTSNLERMVRFYRDALGLAPHSVHQDFVVFQFGNFRLNLGVHDKIQGHSNDPYRIMINLETSEIHHLSEVLQNQGVQFLRLPELEHWGGYVATFRDPEGNLLQLLQFPKTVTPIP